MKICQCLRLYIKYNIPKVSHHITLFFFEICALEMREMLVYKYTQTMEYFSIQSVGLVWLTSNRMFGSGRIFKNTLGQFIPNRSRKHVITSTNFIDYTMWPTTLLVFYKVFTLTQCQTLRKVLMQLNPLSAYRAK